jgi:hypothetical protein
MIEKLRGSPTQKKAISIDLIALAFLKILRHTFLPPAST